MTRHEGPFPLDPATPIQCDRCGRDLYRRDGYRAFTNPYGYFGWTVYCTSCDVELKALRARLRQPVCADTRLDPSKDALNTEGTTGQA